MAGTTPLLLCFLVFSATVVAVFGGVSPPGAGNRIPVDGNNVYLLGANYPWGLYNGNSNYGRDFGQNAWGYSGFAASGNSAVNAAQFQQLQSAGARFVRVWVFADGRAGINLDNQGYPAVVDPLAYNDMDALIALARQYNLKLVLVLFDFHLGFKAQTNNGVQLGGHNSWINFPPHVTSLTNNVIRPFLQHYGNNDVIHSWEVMNEPEWIIWDLPQGSYKSWEADGCSMKEFNVFASGICSAVHQLTNHYCTLGSASLKWARVWVNSFAASRGYPQINLDYYQAHYYSWMDGQTINNDPALGTVSLSPMVQDYASLGLDRPMVIGEFYDSSSSFGSQLDTFLSKGYAGAWPWSVNSDYAIDFTTMRSWYQAHSGVVSAAAPSVPTTGNKNTAPGSPKTANKNDAPSTGNKNVAPLAPGDKNDAPVTGNKNVAPGNPEPANKNDAPSTGNKNVAPLAPGDKNDAPVTGNKNVAPGNPEPANKNDAPITGNKNGAPGGPEAANKNDAPVTGNKNDAPVTGNKNVAPDTDPEAADKNVAPGNPEPANKNDAPITGNKNDAPVTGNKNDAPFSDKNDDALLDTTPLGSEQEQNSEGDDDLSGGAIAGIVVAVVSGVCLASVVVGAVIVAIIVGVMFARRRRRRYASQIGSTNYYVQMIDAHTNP
eukprot:TRINITY_DN616_c0_g1_i5.p1 TRINITY_DN616_c0_g1~~TRINITY_DN616_c0_g1_i5.p1  ORF type:complete len:660 (+),score=119.67 TRINITY_DN616_c0_g1_i5:136-2115(+)